MGKRELASSWLPACEEIFLLTKHKITWPYRTGNPLEISSDVMIVLLRNDYKGAACRSLWQELPILRESKRQDAAAVRFCGSRAVRVGRDSRCYWFVLVFKESLVVNSQPGADPAGSARLTPESHMLSRH
jgi:hypothetical protein